MIYWLLADLYKTVKIHHDNTEVKQSNVVLMYSSSSVQLLQLGQIQVGRPEFWIQNFEIRRWRETVTVATASCVRAYENLDLHSSPVLAGHTYFVLIQNILANLPYFIVTYCTSFTSQLLRCGETFLQVSCNKL